MTSARSRRRVLRFRLRTIFVLITLSGIGLAWLGSNFQRGKRQETAIRGLASLPFNFNHEPVVPEIEWLVNAMGRDFCAKVTQVVYPGRSGFVRKTGKRLPNGKIERWISEEESGGGPYKISTEAYEFLRRRRRDRSIDSHLMHLAGFHDLELLDLKYSGVSGFGLKDVSRLQSLKALILSGNSLAPDDFSQLATLDDLETLVLSGTGIDDRGLAQLCGLRKLRELRLDRARITNEGLESLRAFDSLRELSLCGVKGVTDEGMANVGRLVHLTTLNLYGTNLTSAGLDSLTRLNQLRELDLRKTKIDSHAFSRIAALHNLRTLRLGDTDVVDRGIEKLSKLPNLETIDLSTCQVTDAGLRELSHLSNIKSLTIEGTAVTGDGISEFRKLKPDCEVRRIVFHMSRFVPNIDRNLERARSRPLDGR